MTGIEIAGVTFGVLLYAVVAYVMVFRRNPKADAEQIHAIRGAWHEVLTAVAVERGADFDQSWCLAKDVLDRHLDTVMNRENTEMLIAELREAVDAGL